MKTKTTEPTFGEGVAEAVQAMIVTHTVIGDARFPQYLRIEKMKEYEDAKKLLKDIIDAKN